MPDSFRNRRQVKQQQPNRAVSKIQRSLAKIRYFILKDTVIILSMSPNIKAHSLKQSEKALKINSPVLSDIFIFMINFNKPPLNNLSEIKLTDVVLKYNSELDENIYKESFSIFYFLISTSYLSSINRHNTRNVCNLGKSHMYLKID